MSAPAVPAVQTTTEIKMTSKASNNQVSSEIVNSDAEKTDLRKLGTDMNYKFKLKYPKIMTAIVFHALGLLGLYHAASAKLATLLWAALWTQLGIQSVVLGAHRAYSHNSFKPSTSLTIALIFFHSSTGQGSIFWWARDHRVHHKYTDTDADPYNSTRGFYFSHVSWLHVKKHPLVVEKSKQIDVSDLLSNKLLMFQIKYFWPLYIISGVIIPIIVPMYAWNETFLHSMTISFGLRTLIVYHCIATINSFAHMYGTKPFDARINPVQSNLVHWLTGGDGWHNFHHCFPWDYGLGEFGYGKGLSTLAIEFFAKHGFATDLKRASMRVVEGHSKRHGDGSNFNY